jgi:hypothetical protein
MSSQNFTSTFSVEQTPEEVYAAINNVRGWWTGDIEGGTDTLGDSFTYRYEDVHYSKQEIVELVSGQRIVWRVTDAHLKVDGDPKEWVGTEIRFEISPRGDQTEVRFAHRGLVPEFECFDNCSNAWGFFVNGSLRRLIATSEGPATPPWA